MRSADRGKMIAEKCDVDDIPPVVAGREIVRIVSFAHVSRRHVLSIQPGLW
jgi:hypothetical protein